MRKMDRGQNFIWNGKQCTYQASINLEMVQVFIIEEQCFASVPIGELVPIRLNTKGEKTNLDESSWASDSDWKKARLRFSEVKKYLDGKRGQDDIRNLAKKISLSIPRSYALVRIFDEEAGPQCMLPQRKGRKAGAHFLLEQVESIIKESIRTEWSGPGTTYIKVWRRVKEHCIAANYPVPAIDTVRARIGLLSLMELERKKSGSKHANDMYQPRPGKDTVSAPLEKWEMDHCVVDCIIVDEITRKPLCRPWATLIIDVCTRVVMGFYLSIHAPSSYSVAMAITHAVLPKDKWLKALGDPDLSYPYYGRPNKIVTDNAKEFRSAVLKHATNINNIKMKWRPINHPWWGGTIERLNGTLNMAHIHFLPGTTLSNVVVRGDYDSEKESCLTFSEFRLWFARSIQQYHRTKHRILGMAPHDKWLESFTVNGVLSHPALVNDPRSFSLDFMPEVPRVISRSGIEFSRNFYWSPEIVPYICRGRELMVKYNPNSIKQIWVRVPEGRYIEVPFADLTLPDITLEEKKIARRKLKEQGGLVGTASSQENEREIIKQAVKNRQLVEQAKQTTKRVRKACENSKDSEFFRLSTPISKEEALDDKGGSSSVGVDYTKPASPFDIDL